MTSTNPTDGKCEFLREMPTVEKTVDKLEQPDARRSQRLCLKIAKIGTKQNIETRTQTKTVNPIEVEKKDSDIKILKKPRATKPKTSPRKSAFRNLSLLKSSLDDVIPISFTVDTPNGPILKVLSQEDVKDVEQILLDAGLGVIKNDEPKAQNVCRKRDVSPISSYLQTRFQVSLDIGNPNGHSPLDKQNMTLTQYHDAACAARKQHELIDKNVFYWSYGITRNNVKLCAPEDMDKFLDAFENLEELPGFFNEF